MRASKPAFPYEEVERVGVFAYLASFAIYPSRLFVQVENRVLRRSEYISWLALFALTAVMRLNTSTCMVRSETLRALLMS